MIKREDKGLNEFIFMVWKELFLNINVLLLNKLMNF